VAWASRNGKLSFLAPFSPHGGDGGPIGDEESKVIAPAVREAQARSIDARGPLSADSVFVRALHGEFDAVMAMYHAVVAMYHDQGHIPI